tara:strand:- start:147 stop:320 length:174 start_codon:yes stop_codon:yes gene_type:complete
MDNSKLSKDVCDMFDTTSKTLAQVARHFGLTVGEIKDILMADADAMAVTLQRELETV